MSRISVPLQFRTCMIAQILPPSALYDKSRDRIVLKSRWSVHIRAASRNQARGLCRCTCRRTVTVLSLIVPSILLLTFLRMQIDNRAIRGWQAPATVSTANPREGKRSSLYSPSWGGGLVQGGSAGHPSPDIRCHIQTRRYCVCARSESSRFCRR